MSIVTKFLKLFEYDPETDGASTFNIPKALNENWDKIDAWASGIKDTIAGLVPSTRTINKKPLSADVTLTGEDIPAGAEDEKTLSSHLAELDSALSNKVMQIGNVTQSQVDNLNYACTMVGSFQPHITGLPRSGHGIIIFYSYTDQSKQNGAQEVIYTDGDRYWRKAVNDAVTPWFRVATATPPEEIPLNLAAGISVVASHPALFWKNQFGEVTVVVSASKATPFIDTEVIATLPEGFRPKYTMIFPCVASDTRDTGFLYMDRLGAIQVSFGSKSEKNVIACFSFVAAP